MPKNMDVLSATDYTIKNGEDGKLYIMCILSQFFKKKKTGKREAGDRWLGVLGKQRELPKFW